MTKTSTKTAKGKGKTNAKSNTKVNPETSQRQRVLEGMAIWGSYYRENIDVFVKEYLGLDYLKWFQYALLSMMFRCRVFVMVASRGLGKTFLIAIFACAYCILYPGSKVVITSKQRSQSMEILGKIKTELMPNSPNLCNEIDQKESKFTGQDAAVTFKNTSFIKVVTASDGARGNRATILIEDEYRMVNKEISDTVLKKFLTSRRMPPYKELTSAEKKKEYAKEPNKTFFLSSAFFKDHWSYAKMIDTFKMMLTSKHNDFVCGFPYQLSIQEGLLFPEDVESDMLESDFSEIKWSMEMEALWFGDEGGTFFDFGEVSKTRKLAYPMLPDRLSVKLGGKGNKSVKIPPKENGELRLISVDVALMASNKAKKKKNDASAIFINQLFPIKVGRYASNIVYCENHEGLHTADLSLIVRKLYEEYQCDYIVVDSVGVGMGVFDALVREITDPDTGETYPALSCCNNPEMAARYTTIGADKVIWAVKGNTGFNSDCALLLREGFRSGKIRLLATEYDGEASLSELRGYKSLNPMEKLELQSAYIHTTLLIKELAKLQHDESGGRVRIHEKSTERKDRYSSLSYNFYVATQLESKLRKRNSSDVNMQDSFVIRAPKSSRRKQSKKKGVY